jgi:hypothetical protein
MENEIMNYENEVNENEVDIYEMEPENPGISTGLAMLIGAGITAVGVAAVGLGKKLWANHKAKKELRLVDDGETVEVTDERVREVTK